MNDDSTAAEDLHVPESFDPALSRVVDDLALAAEALAEVRASTEAAQAAIDAARAAVEARALDR